MTNTTFDWKTSGLHIDWLGEFKKPKNLQSEIEAFSKLHSAGTKRHRVDIKQLTQLFVSEGLLVALNGESDSVGIDTQVTLTNKGVALVAELKAKRKEAEKCAKKSCFQALLNRSFDEAYNIKEAYISEYHSTRWFFRTYKTSEAEAFTLIALKYTLSPEFVDDPDKWMLLVDGGAQFKSDFLRWASRVNHKIIEKAEESDTDHLRAAFFMGHLWSEKSDSWLPKHLQVGKQTTAFRAPEIQIEAIKIENGGEGKSLFLGDVGKALSVEDVTIEYYRNKGFKGIHLENRCWWVICHCLYWDVIYADIPYVQEYLVRMRTDHLRSVPPDYHSKIFYNRRSSLITARHQQLRQIASDSDSGIVKQFTEAWKHFLIRFPQTNVFNPTPFDQHIEILRLLSIEQLIPICDRILRDPGTNSKGFPDLFLTRDNKIQLVEVKQPQEKIMDHQLGWHEFFTSIGIPVEICRVVSK